MNLTRIRHRLVGVTLALVAGASLAQPYRVDFLPSPGSRYWTPSGINNLGQAAGTVGDSHFPQAVTWDTTRPTTPLTYLPTYEECCTYIASSAAAINDRGQVVGEDTGRAALWNGTTRPTLLQGGEFGASLARDVNESGSVVGYIGGQATLWDAAGMHALGSLGGASSDAYAINEGGTIAGSSGTHAVTWQNGTITDLGLGSAHNLNDHGVVVGRKDERAVVWNGTQTTFLGALGSEATDINNSGWVVGSYFDELSGDPMRAMLWRDGQSIDLNSFLGQAMRDAGWQLVSATAINDHGWIVGTAFNPLSYTGTAFVMSIPAVPEPASMLLLAVGLGVLGTAARRRNGTRAAQA